MPYEVRVEGNFAAAHALRGYEGACERLHGHNFKVSAAIQSDGINKIGISIDFKVLNNILNKLLEQLDHRNLNEVEPFTENNPTAENIAAFIFRKLGPEVSELGATLKSVTVEESNKYAATYYP